MVLLDLSLGLDDIDAAPQVARQAEHAGYAGFVVSETKHDAFLPLVQAAAATESIQLATAIAIAFARNPMTLAHLGYDLQRISHGRFVLGLGSQIKPHIENRYGMPWGKPVARMREMLAALRAIWATWHDGVPLRFEGEFYRHTLMTPMFAPAAHAYGPPKVRVAAVGPAMTQAAGELADGVICHAFMSPEYLRTTTVPALERGAQRAGRDLADVEITGLLMSGLARTDEEYHRADRALRKQIAFYASTPSYVGVLEAHGWGDLQGRLRELSKEGKWEEMAGEITDEMLHTLALLGTPEEVAAGMHRRYGGLVDRFSLYTPQPPSPKCVAAFLQASAVVDAGPVDD